MNRLASRTRFSRRCLALVACVPLALVTATCQLGDLVKPDAPGKLTVSPEALADSAQMGSGQTRTQMLSITTDGSSGGAWKASLARGSQWITLGRLEDTVPANLTISLKPNGLSAGMYKDTIQLSSGDRTDDMVRVPVSFAVFNHSTGPSPVTELDQLNGDSATVISVGGASAQGVVVLKGRVSDPDAGDHPQLEVELKAIGTAFNGSSTSKSAAVSSGALAYVRIPGLEQGRSYHWRARAVDQTGNSTGWVSFGDNAEDAADFRAGPQRPPNPPGSMGQFRIDGTTAIATGGLTTERTVIFRATLTDPDAGDSLRLEAEVQPLGVPFSNVPNALSAQIASGGDASAAATGLADYTSYHWQARVTDRSGSQSAWTGFGGNNEGEADFRVVLPPTRLVFLTEPSNTAAGAAISPAVRVAVQDAGGSTLSYFTGDITVALSANAGNARLGGTTTVAAVNGIATFNNLTVDRTGTGYTLAASASGLPGVTSAAFDVGAGTATRLIFSIQPSNTTTGTAISPAVRVTAQDASGNTATGFTGNITIAIGTNPSAGTLGGIRVVAASAGQASFATLTIDRTGTGYTLQASATGLTGATSTGFDITAGAVSASQSTIAAAPASIAAGTATSTVTVTARDAGGAVVPGATVTVAATGTANTFTPASGTTNASGVFTTAFSSTSAGPKTISATINTTAVTGTATVTVNPGPATHLVFTTGPSSTTSGSPITPAVVVAAHDAYENTATSFGANITVALGANPGGGTLSGTVSRPATGGAASFGDLSINNAGTGYTLQASGTGVPTVTSAPFNVTAGATSASQSTVGSSAGTVTASGGTSTVTITVTARDAAGSPLAGASVTLASTGTGNTLTPGSGTTNASGVMTATFSSTVAQGKTISATVNGVAITQTAAVTVNPAAAAAVVFTVQPGNTRTNTDIAPAVAVTARDAYGNTATSFTGGVTVAIGTNPAAGTLSGTTTAAAANGVASFAGLRINNAGTGYTLTASATGVSGATSTAFNITP